MPIPLFLGGALAAVLGTTAAGVAGAAAAAGTAGVAAYKLAKGAKEYYSTDEAAKILRISKPTILKKIKEGSIPYEGSIGRNGFRIKSDAINFYASENGIKPNWGAAIVQISSTDKEAIVEMIKLKELEKREAELDVDELELDADSTIENKRKLIQAKKKVASIEKEIQGWKMFLSYIEDESE